MKKNKLAVFCSAGLAIVLFIGVVEAKILRKGMRGVDVEDIQEILSEDSAIYPEGLVTGYFGPLTEGAIKRLQARCGLERTGVIDKETEECIFPVIRFIKVISPNGGEVWDRSEIQTITWEVNPWTEKEPFWPKASIDLFRRVEAIPLPLPTEESETRIETRRSVFVKHIGFTNLYDEAYSWRIDPEIKNGSDYIIRVSVGKGLVPHWREEFEPEEIWPPERPSIPVPPVPPVIYWDESDEPFSITGEVGPKPPADLKPVIALLEEAIESLNKALRMLYELAE